MTATSKKVKPKKKIDLLKGKGINGHNKKKSKQQLQLIKLKKFTCTKDTKLPTPTHKTW